MKQVRGEFDLKSTINYVGKEEKSLGLMKMMFEKTYHGAISGKSLSSMMGLFEKEIHSGGYVAIERFEGTVDYCIGSFYIQHSSILDNGHQFQNLNIIPHSGTGELANISGTMVIEIKDGRHFYVLDYEL